MSLFELPVSKGARTARVVAVVMLNLVLAGAGIAMIASYLGERAEAANGGGRGEAPEPEPPDPQLEVLEPDAVDVDEVKHAPSKPAKKVAVEGNSAKPKAPQTSAKSSSSGKGSSSAAKTPAKSDDDVKIPLPRKPPSAGSDPTSDDTADDADDPDVDPDAVDDGVGPDGTAEDDSGTIDDTVEDDARVEFSAALVRRVVDKHTVQLQRCYKAAAKVRPVSDPLGGRVDVQFVINPDGTASNVTPVANSTGSEELATCVSKSIETWEFPSPGAEDIAFVWPFVFKAP